jgi:hypothetical protein
MKTINLILKVVVGAFLVFSVTACSKDKKGNNNGTGYGYGQYYMQNGICINRSTGQTAPQQYCMNQGGNTGWTYQNGICVNIQTGQQDPTGQMCLQGGGGGFGVQCYGQYYSPQTGETGQCYGQNCRGWYLCQVGTQVCQQCN